MDEALGLPTESSARLALRTQQILAEESGVTNTVDPLGGSYEIEYLTDRIELDAREYFDRIEHMGGALAAIEKGFVAGEIAKEAYRVARARERKEEIVVGVNEFTEGNPRFSLFPEVGASGVHIQRITPAEERQQVARAPPLASGTERAAVDRAIGELRGVTDAGANVMPAVLNAVRVGCTLGEISDVWRSCFGEQRASRAF